MSTTYPSDLSDTEWACVQQYLPPLPTRGRPRTHSLRRILDAIFYLLRTGCAWRYLPSDFPPWQTVFYHFRRFRLQGTWHLLYTALHRAERERVGRNPDPSAAIIDSQSVKTVEESAHIRGYDAHKRVKARKRHLLVDTLGLPIACYVTLPMSTMPSMRASSWAVSVSCATPPEDLGGCCLPRHGAGRLVQATRWLGSGGRGADAWRARLSDPTAPVGSRALVCLAFSESAAGEGL